MNIVETKDQLDLFEREYTAHPSIVFPMWEDTRLHPMRSNISFIFVRCNHIDYILPINHIDCINQSLSEIMLIIESSSQLKIVFQLKSLLYGFNLFNSIDADSLLFISNDKLNGHYKQDWKNDFVPILSFYNSIGYNKNVIKSIPILKLTEIISGIVDKVTDIPITDDIKWYSAQYIPTLSKIEKSGLIVDRVKFLLSFNKLNHITDDNIVYTEYNPYTSTGRPSNRHGGVNYSALNKNDGTRDVFISGDNNFLIQFDFDSYHLRIIGNLINETMPKESIHQWFAEMYNTTYEDSKKITFKQIYGGIDSNFLHIPFFQKTQDFIDRLWETVNEVGYIQTLHRKIPLKWIDNPDPNKVFNYLLQGLETEINIDKINKIFKIIEDTDIKLILYTYDSFIFRSSIKTDIDLFKSIIDTLEEGNYPIKRKIGYTFGSL